jgi:hypothetical protein
MEVSRFEANLEANSNRCVFIKQNGERCKFIGSGDPLAQGMCYRHRDIKVDKRTSDQRREDCNQKDIEEEIHGKQPKTNEDKLREQIWKEYFEKLFSKYEATKTETKTRNTKTDKKTSSILKDRAIETKDEWKIWIVNNHPDRGGDTEMFINVLKAGRDVFFDKR